MDTSILGTAQRINMTCRDAYDQGACPESRSVVLPRQADQHVVAVAALDPIVALVALAPGPARAATILPSVTKPITPYGFSEEALVRAVNVRADGGRMHFTAQRINGKVTEFDVTLNLPGLHYVQNALAAIAVASELNVSDTAIAKALSEFRGVGRRFERYGEVPAKTGGVRPLKVRSPPR